MHFKLAAQLQPVSTWTNSLTPVKFLKTDYDPEAYQYITLAYTKLTPQDLPICFRNANLSAKHKQLLQEVTHFMADLKVSRDFLYNPDHHTLSNRAWNLHLLHLQDSRLNLLQNLAYINLDDLKDFLNNLSNITLISLINELAGSTENEYVGNTIAHFRRSKTDFFSRINSLKLASMLTKLPLNKETSLNTGIMSVFNAIGGTKTHDMVLAWLAVHPEDTSLLANSLAFSRYTDITAPIIQELSDANLLILMHHKTPKLRSGDVYIPAYVSGLNGAMEFAHEVFRTVDSHRFAQLFAKLSVDDQVYVLKTIRDYDEVVNKKGVGETNNYQDLLNSLENHLSRNQIGLLTNMLSVLEFPQMVY